MPSASLRVGCIMGSMSAHTVGVIPVFSEADRMRKAREITGLDRAAFADLVGVSAKTVLNYETGATTRVKPLVRRAWALATGVPAVWLETGEAPPPGGPEEGLLNECAVRDSNPEPSDYGWATPTLLLARSA